MSMINFMNYFLSTTEEGFVPFHAPLKNNKHLNIPFQSTQPRRGKDKSELQGLTPSSRVRACRTKRGAWGRVSILSVMPNAAPDKYTCFNAILSNHPTLTLPHRVQKSVLYICVSFLLSCIQGCCYHLSKFHIYALIYCIGVFLSGLLHSV